MSKEVEQKIEDPDRSEWFVKAMNRNPSIKKLRERIYPTERASTFGEVYNAGRKSNKIIVEDELILQLVMQHLMSVGCRKTRKKLEEESGIKYKAHFLRDSRLQTIIRRAVSEVDKLYDTVLSGSSPDSHFVNLGLEDDADEITEDIYIWDEPEGGIIEKDKEIVAATLNRLVEKLTDTGDYSMRYTKPFLMTYHNYVTPRRLLSKLIQRYRVPEEIGQGEALRIQIRVINMIKQWIAEHPGDFTEGMNQLDEFQEVLVSDGHVSLAEQLNTALERHVRQRSSDIKLRQLSKSTSTSIPEPRVPKTIFSPSLSLDDVDPIEMARQMCLIDFEIYSKVTPAELLIWNKPKYRSRAPNIKKLTVFSNRVARWVGTTILRHNKVRERAREVIRVIKLAKHLRAYNNFERVFSVIAGLEVTEIQRLNSTFDEIPTRYLEIEEALSAEMSSQNAYSTYRELVKHINPPGIPYLGVSLSDLVAIEEGNPDYIQFDEMKLINFAKMRLLYSIPARIQDFQVMPYDFQPVVQIQKFLLNLPRMNEREMYEKSLKVEPREVK